MTDRYSPMLESLKDVLAGMVPARTVTREFKDFAQRDQSAVMSAGIYMIQSAYVSRYDYETSGQGTSDRLRATAQGRLRFTIIGQQYLGEDASGLDVDAAEFEMLDELEALADEAIETEDGLKALTLIRADFSQQAETPWAWIVTVWEIFSLD